MEIYEETFLHGIKYGGSFHGFRVEENGRYRWEGIGIIRQGGDNGLYKTVCDFNFRTYDYELLIGQNPHYFTLREIVPEISKLTESTPYSICLPQAIMPKVYDIFLSKIIDNCIQRDDPFDMIKLEPISPGELIKANAFIGERTSANGHTYLCSNIDQPRLKLDSLKDKNN